MKKNNMKKLALVVTGIVGTVPHLVMADVYVGGKAGYTWIQDNCTVIQSCDKESGSGGVYAGFNATQYFGIEAGYDWLGEFKSDYLLRTNASDGDIQAFTLAPRLRYPIGNASVYGKLGVAVMTLEDMKDTSLMGALGLEYNLSENFTTRIEYQRIENELDLNDVNLNSFYLGLAYRFGANKVAEPAGIEVEPVSPVEIVEPEPKPEPKPEPVIEKEFRIFKEFGVELFAQDKSELSHASLEYFDWIVAKMKAFPQAQLTIIGHTDSTGSAEYNQKLSERRARSVANYLYANGIERSRVQVIGEGENRPKTSNDTAAGRLENRRVEIIIDEFEYQVD